MDTNILNERVKTTVTRTVGLTSSKGADDTKKITLRLHFDTTVATLLNDAVKTDVIRWQTPNRKRHETFTDGQIIDRTYGERDTLTDEQKRSAYKTWFATLSDDEKQREIERLTND